MWSLMFDWIGIFLYVVSYSVFGYAWLGKRPVPFEMVLGSVFMVVIGLGFMLLAMVCSSAN